MIQSNISFKKIKFLSELPLAESEELSRACEMRSYAAKATVFSQGNKLPGVFVVAKGALKIYRASGKDKIQVLDVIKPGRCVGEVQVFSDGIAATNALACGATECWIIPATILRQMILRNPVVAEVMLRHLAEKVLHLIPLVETLSLHTVPERVAQLIIDYHRDNLENNIVEFRETQEELSQYVGTSREAFNRSLRLLCDLGFIQSTFPVIHITEPQKLQRYAKGS
jgi:CRP-like cAMP-binding protein